MEYEKRKKHTENDNENGNDVRNFEKNWKIANK